MLSLFGFLLSIWTIPQQAHEPKKIPWTELAEDIDWSGTLLATSLTALLFSALAVITNNVATIGRSGLFVPLALGWVLLVAFLFWHDCWERDSTQRIQDSLWTNCHFLSIGLVIFFVYASSHSTSQLVIFVFQRAQGLSALRSSWQYLPIPMAGALSTLLTGYFSPRVEANRILVVAIVLSSLSPLFMATLNLDWPYWKFAMPAVSLNPVASNSVIPIATMIVAGSLPLETQGLAMGVLCTVAMVGASVGMALAALISNDVSTQLLRTPDQNTSLHEFPEILMSGYRTAFWFLFSLNLVGLAVTLGCLRKLGYLGQISVLKGNTMSPPKQRILFLTSPEHGQSNVALAVAEEFLHRGEFEVHIASFKELSARVQAINDKAEYDKAIHFHPIAGPSMSEIVTRTIPDICHRPGLAGTQDACKIINISVLGWKPDEYILSYWSCLGILRDVRPVVVVADPLLHLGLDAARSIDSRIVILWPVPLKDIVITVQPKAGIFWKYPLTGSGYPYPLPWRLILANVYMVFCFGWIVRLGKPMRDLLDVRKKAGIRTTFPHVAPYCENHLHLSPSFREMDFPLYVPDNVISCGPIVRSFSSLIESDPALDSWLKEPTILICLGSHVQAPEDDAMQMAVAIQVVLREFPDVQVLWKLKYDWKSSPKVKNILGPLVNSDKVRIFPWIQPEIISILEGGNIVAYVHHGGANSFFEACK
ncbi:Major facilitator superfamily domain, general substrate transporter [Penicillium italicum]|uniref:Major facilitator superfamily domain, general substrate transporter n=1 Tax=Penicillium italicum TaxID=40296 RepID=A0A0A2KWI1_PENIT|nr:Major facilitator superfamily domain, general substrate transporter [Penicillium italicum]